MSAIDVQAPGPRLFDPYPVTDGVANTRGANSQSGLTALAGGGQTDATQLNNGFNEVTVVATNDDSVQLPAAVAGTWVFVANADAGQNIKVFGKEGRSDTINGTAGATGVAQAAATNAIYYCPADTKWYKVTSA